jgi:trigger factor
MAVKLEVNEGIKRVFGVDVPKVEIDSAMDKKVQEVAGQARLPGFRPGKVPLQVVRQQFGDSIRGEVVSKTIETAYGQLIVEYKLKPAGLPKITVDEPSIKKGDLSFKIELEVFHEFEVKVL